jgi:hypothetical protein
VQEAEPLVLDRSHDETIHHESGQSLKVEWWRQELGVWDELFSKAMRPAVHVVNLNGESVASGVRTTGFANGALSDCCEGLCDRVGYTTEDLGVTLEGVYGRAELLTEGLRRW